MLSCHVFWNNSVNLTKETATDWRHGWLSLILLLVSLWTYMGSQYCLAKAKNFLLLPVTLFNHMWIECSMFWQGAGGITQSTMLLLNFILFYFTCMYLLCVCECICIWVDVCTHAHVCTCVETWGQPQVFSPIWVFWGTVSPVTWSLLIKPG